MGNYIHSFLLMTCPIQPFLSVHNNKLASDSVPSHKTPTITEWALTVLAQKGETCVLCLYAPSPLALRPGQTLLAGEKFRVYKIIKANVWMDAHL